MCCGEGDAFVLGTWSTGLPAQLSTTVLKRSLNHQSSINHHLINAMFSTVIRRAMPSLRQARSYTAAAHTQASASSSKLDEGERAIHDKLSEHFQPSELLVQDVSGACHSHILPTSVSFGKRVFWGEYRYKKINKCIHYSLLNPRRWLWVILCHYHCERGL